MMEQARNYLEVDEPKEKQRSLRAVVVKKSNEYFRDTNNRSSSEQCLFNRRKNLVKHLGEDESIDKQDLDKINMAALPFPSSVPKYISR